MHKASVIIADGLQAIPLTRVCHRIDSISIGGIDGNISRPSQFMVGIRHTADLCVEDFTPYARGHNQGNPQVLPNLFQLFDERPVHRNRKPISVFAAALTFKLLHIKMLGYLFLRIKSRRRISCGIVKQGGFSVIADDAVSDESKIGLQCFDGCIG